MLIFRLEIKMESSHKKLLYMDGLNYADSFFQREGSFWKIEDARQLVAEFVEATRNSGWKLEVFIDAGIQSDEAQRKWKERREDDVRTGSLGMPVGLQFILSSLYIENGIKVHHSKVDNDDTLAAYAQAHGAAILSRDKDFFRYRQMTYTVYKEFDIHNGKLLLTKRDFFLHDSPRALMLDPLPETYKSLPTIDRISLTRQCQRGASSPLTKVFGNIQTKIMPLKRQFFFEIGIPIDQTIRVYYPEWDKKKKQVIWVDELVTPCDDPVQKSFLYDNPFGGIDYYFWEYITDMIPKPESCSKNNWMNHKFCCCATILELSCILTGNSFVDMLLQAKDKYFVGDKQSRKDNIMKAAGALKKNCDRCGKNFEISEKERRKLQEMKVKESNRCQKCLFSK
ncbi:hypothetical protein FGO68_gene2387 [Halteria grandinella]|uniref:NYN domain-containing protein n=1 Tax=Halteria grandinella TaxID=5974 RepID=A0A8J8NNZ9_HALGN|nr:hypothetical protein FGO68_gene2387 [Halteria grandinella]